MTNKKLIGLMLLMSMMASCQKKEAPRSAEIIPEVTVMKVSARDVPLTKEFVGQVAGFRDIEVRSRVGGILMKRYYTEGALVKEGDPLFLIDPEPFKVSLRQAASVVSIERARFDNSKRAYDRTLKLYKENAVSQKDRDDAVAYYEGSKSSLETAKAKWQNAQIDLGYTTVRAPISGYTSAEIVSEGSLMVANSDKSLLTVISQTAPAYVNFTYTESEMLALRKDATSGKLGGKIADLKVKIKLGDASIFPEEGRLNFNDIIIDSTTGTIRARALFPNAQNVLKAGQFVRVLVEGFTLKSSFLIPQRAVVYTQKGPIGLIVDKNSVAQMVSLELGQEMGNDVLVQKGLRNGDVLIVEGVTKVRQGQKVKIAPEKSIAKNNLKNTELE